MDISIRLLIVVALAAAFVYWLARQRGGSTRDAEAYLRQKVCHGSADQAERLIQGEMQRTPGLPRAEAAARAIARYRRDNR